MMPPHPLPPSLPLPIPPTDIPSVSSSNAALSPKHWLNSGVRTTVEHPAPSPDSIVTWCCCLLAARTYSRLLVVALPCSPAGPWSVSSRSPLLDVDERGRLGLPLLGVEGGPQTRCGAMAAELSV